MTERYFSIADVVDEGNFEIPKILFSSSEYRSLTTYAKLTWAIFVDLLEDCYEKGWICEETKRIYCINPESYVNSYFEYDSDYDFELVTSELVKYQLLEIEQTSFSSIKRYFLQKPKYSRLSKSSDDITRRKKEYLKNVTMLQQENHNDEQIAKKNEAIAYIDGYFEYTDLKQLTDQNKLILYEHIDKIEWLKKYNRFSLSLILTLKTKYSLSADYFNHLLNKAFQLYSYDEENPIHFTQFFSEVIENQEIVNKREKLIWEIDQKLVSVPNELKNFVYSEMRKYEEKFPDRYELLLNNLRIINTIYQDFDDIPNEVFKKAFRRLFMDYKIHHLGSYFKKGIQFLLDDMNYKESDPVENSEESQNENWLEQLFGNVNDSDSLKEERDEQKIEEYEKRKEALNRKLKRLK